MPEPRPDRPADPQPTLGQGPGPMMRWWTLLLALVLIGMPLMVSGNLLGLRPESPVFRGEQPGGTLSGHLTGGGEPLAGVEVELRLTGEGRGADPVAATRTDAEGAWSLAAPPVSGGAYRLRAGGGDWRYRVVETGFLDREGEPLDPNPIDLELVPGCTLDVRLVYADGRPVGGGEFTVRGTYRSEGLLALVPQILEFGPRAFEDAHIVQGGLPPVRGEVQVTLDSGQLLTFEVELVEGRNELRYEL